MLLATMATIMILLVAPARQWELSELSELSELMEWSEDTSRESDQPWADRARRRREWYTRIRLSEPRQRRSGPEPAPAEPLQLPDDLLEPQLHDLESEEARLSALHRFTADAEDSDAAGLAGFTVCCPAVEERTSPRAGLRLDGSLGLLYADPDFQQIFFERSCSRQAAAAEGDSEVERQLRRRVRCEQEYSNSYAVYNISGSKVLDYIRIRSGCRCQIRRKSKRKKRKRKVRRRGGGEGARRSRRLR